MFKNVKVTFKCPQLDKKTFSISSCSVTVSMCNVSQRGAKFAATIYGITNNFKECTIMVCDTLQRHNLLVDGFEDISSAHEKAFEIGNDWLRENEQYFSLFTIPYKVIRWDYWLLHEKYKFSRIKIDDFFEKNDKYRQAFYNATNDFVSRLEKRNTLKYFDFDKAKALSLEYLKEECAVMLLWADNKYNFEIYPSKRNDAMRATYYYFIANKYANVLKSVALYIRTR